MTTTLAVQSVSVDGWTAYDHPNPPVDEFGNVWIWQTITGWFGGVDVRAAPIPRLLADGDYDGPATFGGRTVEIAGVVIAQNRAGLQLAMDRVARVLAGQVRRGALIVDEAVVPVARTISVRLGGSTLVERTATLQASWSISLYSSDSVRYGLTQHVDRVVPYVSGVGRTYNLTFPRTYGALGSNGRLTVHNLGDANSHPTITFYGPVTNPAMRIVGGDRIKLMMAIAVGEFVVIDCAKRTVDYGGSSRRHLLTSDSRWLLFGPGRTDLFYSSDNGSGEAVVVWSDAWS